MEKIRELINYSNKGILSKTIVKNDSLNVTLFSMAAGTEISEHTSTKSGFVYVVEGKGIFNLEKDMADVVNKLGSVFRVLFTPGAIQAVQSNPELAKLLNQMLEGSGMNQINFSQAPQTLQPTAPQLAPGGVQPQGELVMQ